VPHPTAVRLFDATLGFLLRPRVRRVRRWSFLVTLPLGVLAGRATGLELGEGLLVGLAVVALEAAALVAALVLGGRLLGEERREALLDLLMHPVVRRAILGEARLLLTLPGLLVRRARRPGGEAFANHRGSQELALALALLPAMLAEGAAVHLLLPDEWVVARIVIAALHVYGMVMLLSWAVGERTEPHRLRDGILDLRGGRLYRARVPTSAVSEVLVAPRRDGIRSGLVLDGGIARFAVAGRTDVLLRFAAPVEVERPLGAPVRVCELAVAVDDPERFVAAVLAAERAAPAAVTAPPRVAGVLAWPAPGELAEALA